MYFSLRHEYVMSIMKMSLNHLRNPRDSLVAVGADYWVSLASHCSNWLEHNFLCAAWFKKLLCFCGQPQRTG